MLNLYKNIKKLRLAEGMSQEELAHKVGYKDRSSIAKIEAGEVDIPQSKILEFAKALKVTPGALLGLDEAPPQQELFQRKGIKVPVLGKIPAGVPIAAITDILGYEEIDEAMAKRGNFFALKVTGRSMEPTIKENDTVIVRQQPQVENGEIAVVMVNSNEATLKRIRIQADGIWLMPDNPAACAAKFYTGEEIATLPVAIIGKVIELRRNF